MRVEHRLLGVDDQVQQDLLDLVRIGEDRRQAGGQRLDDRDVGDALFVRAQRQRLAHDLIEIDGRPRRVALARERLQVADDAGGALGGVVDGVEIAAGELVEPPAGSAARRTRGSSPADCSARARRPTSSGPARPVSRPATTADRDRATDPGAFALGDVAHQRFDAERLGRQAGARRGR